MKVVYISVSKCAKVNCHYILILARCSSKERTVLLELFFMNCDLALLAFD